MWSDFRMIYMYQKVPLVSLFLELQGILFIKLFNYISLKFPKIKFLNFYLKLR